MTDLIIAETSETPEINFNHKTGILKISGRAYSNDIKLFYQKMDVWLEEYLQNPNSITTIELTLDYYNSVFNKLMFNFFVKCLSKINGNNILTIKWFHQKDDDDSIDEANRISRTIDFPIEKIAIS